ncbi:MAG TPA: hypothetical protein VEY07_06125 [Thermoplasmata archaeon]|nr:hypothetical protein [Thermoplasmata archaeon]
MSKRWLALAAPAVLLLMTLIPAAAGAGVPTVSGLVTHCATSSNCAFAFNTSAGKGWANATNGLMSIQLPGEAKASHNLSYSTYIQSLTGTYTYWTVGNFVGTDVNSGHVIYGTTNTNFTITCIGHSGRGGGCTYVYTTDNGTIVVKLTKAFQTSTSVSCTPSSVVVPKNTSCTVTVSNLWNSSNVPIGKVKLTSGGLGTFANRGTCTLVSGHCTLSWTPLDNTVGTVTILATFPGSATFYKSTGSSTVSVTGGG